MKRPDPENYRDKQYADLFHWEEYARECEKYIDYIEKQHQQGCIEQLSLNEQFYDLQTENKELIKELGIIFSAWKNKHTLMYSTTKRIMRLLNQ